MHIENPEALRSWLTPVLEPLLVQMTYFLIFSLITILFYYRCDADPNALAKYVLALLKKDKPQAELEGCMAEQLDVFLGKETKPFLEKLFVVMKTHEYLKSSLGTTTASIENVPQKEKTPPMSQSSVTTSSSASGGRRTTRIEPESSSSTNKSTSVLKSKSQEPVVKNSTEIRDKRRRNSNRSKSRSRSKRMDRIRRSRSRDRRMVERDAREKIGRSNRNSPPSRRYPHHKNYRSSPSYHYSGNSNRAARSRSASPVQRKSPITRDDNNKPTNNKRCRDFDEKGYCMRGETCPWDHGVDPVVLDPTLAINTPTIAIRSNPIHSEYNPDAPDLWNRGPTDFQANRMVLPVPAPRPPFGFGYRSGPLGGFAPMQGMSQLRELIPVPVVDPNHPGDMPMKRRFENEDGTPVQENATKRKLPINSRLGPRVNNQGGPNPSQNCSLELRKIPRGLNNISHLNDHFTKFGKITNIQVAYEGDPEAAIVTFKSHAEANVAYRSTEAVLNNRFIKVFWHNNNGGSGENQTMNGPTGSLPKVSELSFRKYPATTGQNTTTTPTTSQADSSTTVAKTETSSTTDTSTATTPAVTGPQTIAPKGSTTYINSSSTTAQQIQRIKSVKMIQKKRKEQQIVVVQLAKGLYHKKQELLTKNFDSMKKLVAKLEKTDQLDPTRPQLMSTIKMLQTQIDNLKKELESDSEKIAKTHPTIPVRKTKEQTQKELLDCELELISKEQQGDNDTYEVKKKYLELQKSLKRPGFVPGGVPRPPARPQRFGSTSVDRRPTSIKIMGFALDESDSILGHFKVINLIHT
jgi:RNA-binding protein 26